MSPGPSSPAEEPTAAARAALDRGDPQAALTSLRLAFAADPGHAPAYQAAAACLRALDGADEAALFERALARSDDPEAYFDLGYHFVDVGHEALAVPFLERALALAPGDVEIAAELAVALAADRRPAEGFAALERLDLGRQFGPRYQHAWCALLANRPDVVRRFLDEARPNLAAPDADPAILGAVNELAECLARLETLSDPPPLVQHWHYVQYGAAILDLFEEPEVAGGRYVALWGSDQAVATSLAKLRTLLETLGRPPEQVLALPDRDSEILGRAAARLYDLPFEIGAEPSFARPGALVVAADNRLLADHPALREVQAGQTVFALNLHWLARAPITPDVAGLLTQRYSYPWGERYQVDPASRQVVPIPPDGRPPEAIAAQLAATPPAEDAGFAERLLFYRQHAAHLKGGEQGGERRLTFRKDSPVAGSYFA